MANKDEKLFCFTSRQTKATLRSHLVPVRTSAVKKTRTANAGSGRQKGLVAKGGDVQGLVPGSRCGGLLRIGTRPRHSQLHHPECTPTGLPGSISQTAYHRLRQHYSEELNYAISLVVQQKNG